MRTHKTRITVLACIIGGFVVVVAAVAAAAVQSGFRRPPVEPESVEYVGAGEYPDTGYAAAAGEAAQTPQREYTRSESASLDAVRQAGLLPFEWPWFSETVTAPADAVSAAPELRAAIGKVPSLSGFKMMSSDEVFAAAGPYLQIQSVWLKVNDTQMMLVGTHLIPEGETVELEEWVVAKPVPGGEVAVYTKPGAIMTTLIMGNRLVTVDLQAVVQDFRFVFSENDLVEIGGAIIRALDG
ncbi:MAG: hypothetical protein MUE66_02750 [Acidimicrobiia bacterium]|jgi:hypothetical protein|nr:hypothetical protein [Acidimicrobiia bacterium]